MEMMANMAISGAQMQSTAQGSQGASKGQAAAAGAGFQQALVQQINGKTSSEGIAEQQSSLVAVVSQLAALANNENQAEATTLEELMTAIDGLIDQLSEANGEDEQPVSERQLDELTAALEALQALLALVGAPVVNLQPQPVPNTGSEENANPLQEAAVSVKSSLQDALLQLQAKLQQGPLKQIHSQEPLSFIGEQLRAIAAKLEGVSQASTSTPDNGTEDLPDWLAANASGSKSTQAHLQRLSQQAVHPAFIQSMAEQNASLAEGQTQLEAQPNAIGPVPAAHLPFVSSDPIRDFSSLLSKSAPSTFVLADDFANTMESLIVQRFDVRTINGLAEAKLMLFPEHLGQVDVKISLQNGILTAVFQADNAMAKDMLENQMAQLRAALQAQGLNVDKLEVTQSSSAAQLTNGQFAGGQSGGQQSGDRQGFREDERVTDNAFETELVEQAAIQGLGFGRSINETA